MCLAELATRLLHAQMELLFAQPQQFLVQLFWGFISKVRGIHVYITVLLTNAVANGIFAAARANASRATSSGTPSIS